MSILIENLTHIYSRGKPNEEIAIKDISLTIESGDFIGLIGPTGSGKSTLMKHFNGLLLPTKGRVTVFGHDTRSKNSSDIRCRVGMVFQHPENQLFEGTVYEDIAFGLRNFGMEENTIRDRILKTVAALELGEEILCKSPFELSGGVKRSVAIAGILATEPEMVVLDEPGAGQDARTKKKFYATLKRLNTDAKTTIVVVTHRMEEVTGLANKLILLKNGRLERMGQTAEVLEWMSQQEEHSLRLPPIFHLMRKLKEINPSLNEKIFTVMEAKQEIMKFIEKRV